MKQALEETTKGTPDAAPVVIKPTKARRCNDEIAVEFVLGIKHDKEGPKVETHRERDLWRHADDLAGPSPSPLVSSLALTVALCEADVRLRQALNKPTATTVPRDIQSALNGSMRRYLAACKMLATVQQLGLPPIQVNVATNQVVANG